MSFIFINMSFYVSRSRIPVALTGQECESFRDTILSDGTQQLASAASTRRYHGLMNLKKKK